VETLGYFTLIKLKRVDLQKKDRPMKFFLQPNVKIKYITKLVIKQKLSKRAISIIKHVKFFLVKC